MDSHGFSWETQFVSQHQAAKDGAEGGAEDSRVACEDHCRGRAAAAGLEEFRCFLEGKSKLMIRLDWYGKGGGRCLTLKTFMKLSMSVSMGTPSEGRQRRRYLK